MSEDDKAKENEELLSSPHMDKYIAQGAEELEERLFHEFFRRVNKFSSQQNQANLYRSNRKT